MAVGFSRGYSADSGHLLGHKTFRRATRAGGGGAVSDFRHHCGGDSGAHFTGRCGAEAHPRGITAQQISVLHVFDASELPEPDRSSSSPVNFRVFSPKGQNGSYEGHFVIAAR